jgi:hypothetical protein
MFGSWQSPSIVPYFFIFVFACGELRDERRSHDDGQRDEYKTGQASVSGFAARAIPACSPATMAPYERQSGENKM